MSPPRGGRKNDGFFLSVRRQLPLRLRVYSKSIRSEPETKCVAPHPSFRFRLSR